MQRFIEMLRGMGTRRQGRAATAAPQGRRRASRRAVVGLEGMEGRQMMTAGLTLSGGIINVVATDHGDSVYISRVNNANPALNKIQVDWTHDNVHSHALWYADSIRGFDFYGGSGGDHVTNGTDLPSNLWGGSGNDVLIGGSAADRISGSGGNDFLSGLGGNDIITGGSGNNTITGGEGNDILFATGANYGDGKVASNTNTIYGDGGDDAIFGSTWGTNLLYGGNGNDTIVGKYGSTNMMYGEAGNDLLVGLGVYNYENGGAGSDFMEAHTPGTLNILDGGNDNDPDWFGNQGNPGLSVVTYNIPHQGDYNSAAYHMPVETYPYINQF